MDVLTTFPHVAEFEKAAARLDALGLPYRTVRPEPGYRLVGAPVLVVAQQVRLALAASGDEGFICSGWVEHRPGRAQVPSEEPEQFEEDLFGQAAVVVLASCTADEERIRIIAHITGDVSKAFPYVNAGMETACYNPAGPTLTFMDGYRMVSAYARRIAVAKTDEIVDAWRVLEAVRCRVNEAWARRQDIEPSYVTRRKPPALEIYKRLPQTNCGACGELTCLAFAVKVHGGALPVSLCTPVFRGESAHLREALTGIARALGVEP